jgi:hypothetical protein
MSRHFLSRLKQCSTPSRPLQSCTWRVFLVASWRSQAPLFIKAGSGPRSNPVVVQ